MQGPDGKCSSVTDKASRGGEWENLKAEFHFHAGFWKFPPSHSEAETVINFVCAVKADSFTQGVLKK